MSGTRSATEIDQHVGARLRIRRQLVGMSQEALGERLGVSFQQVQKYERGSNRVSASRLYFLADALGVPVSYFFEGLDESGTLSEVIGGDAFYDFISSPDGVAFVSALSGVEDGPVRRKLLELARSLAKVPTN